ncbi:Ras family protein [Trichomonas vaginalis G3]|uniref:Ras family protein n=1 Tax=Trichomonas vaginalis (strain ATCC PRA-98 / G3) TaxID=412133 RepID=A2G3I9_TRIV3|nr:retrograde vesicle-mediated transport, Golgi to ER [Trichomonas vaginalis G3]EAX88276.1 Ras family protein [Trichomonas vaginalis G3]KAI5528747.1 retrograde vesicle-mediated transport, Golgi to ER [Trichomonas vaginalis G3]|eukprot:XP_001301206.1 Ras family protein [Trichomonas vaginalis G3]
MEDISPNRIKVSIIGDSGVGKTSLAQKEIYGTFDYAVTPTIGTSHLIAHEKVDNVDVEMCLWDTAGQEKYKSLVPLYTRDSDVIIIVASIADHLSVQNVSKWVEMILESNGDPQFLVAINKMDMPIDNSDAILDPLQNEYDDLFLVSAKTGDGVRELFFKAAKMGYTRQTSPPKEKDNQHQVITKNKQKSKSKDSDCC